MQYDPPTSSNTNTASEYVHQQQQSLETSRQTHHLIVHLGGIQTSRPDELLVQLLRFGRIGKYEFLYDGQRSSIRVEFFGSLMKLRDARNLFAKTHPHLRVKLIPSGNTLRRKIYVKIHPVHSRTSLIEYFSTFGVVKRIEIKFNTLTEKPRNFAYVTFKEEADANQVLVQPVHMLSDKYLYCESCQLYKIASPPDAEDVDALPRGGADRIIVSSPTSEPSGPLIERQDYQRGWTIISKEPMKAKKVHEDHHSKMEQYHSTHYSLHEALPRHDALRKTSTEAGWSDQRAESPLRKSTVSKKSLIAVRDRHRLHPQLLGFRLAKPVAYGFRIL